MSVSDMKIEITTSSSPIPTPSNESQMTLIPDNMPEKRGKKGRTKVTQLLVLDSLGPTVPIAVPEAASALQEASNKKGDASSAPSSPNTKTSKSKPFYKRIPRPTSPRVARKYSDPTLGARAGRPKWLGLGFKNKKKSRSAEAMNGIEDLTPSPMGDRGHSPASFELHSSSSSVEPEATPMATLPGQLERTFADQAPKCAGSHSDIPTITVSSHGEGSPLDGGEGCSPATENGFEGDACYRKFSESSQKSQCSTLHSNSGTSGLGSLLSPSGDECEPGSDVESPLSPLSGASSSRGSTEELRHFQDFPSTLSDTDCIEKDIATTLTSPGSDTETRAIATSPPQRGFSPPIGPGEDSGNELPIPGRVTEKRRRSRSASKVRNRVSPVRALCCYRPSCSCSTPSLWYVFIVLSRVLCHTGGALLVHGSRSCLQLLGHVESLAWPLAGNAH